MDDFLKDMDSLFTMADGAAKAPPLVTSEVMRRVNALKPSRDASSAGSAPELPLRFMIGLGSVAAAMAGFFASLSLATWRSLNDPFVIARFLPDIASLLEN